MFPLKHPFSSVSAKIWALTVMLLFAAFLRVSAVDYALPYIVNIDEPNVYRLTQDMRGVLDSGWRGQWLDGYPPGYMVFYGLIVEGMNRLNVFDIHQDMSKVIGMMRIFNSLIDLLTMSFVIYLARQLGGWRAALLAGSIYMVSFPFVRNAAIALRDPLFALTAVMCVVFGLWAWRRDSVRWGLASTALGLVAVAVKYPAAPVLILPALFFLRQLYTRRAAALPGAIAAAAMVAGSAYYLWFAYGGGNLHNIEAIQAKSFFLQNLFEPERWFNVFKAIGGTLGFCLTIAAVLILIDLYRNRERKAYIRQVITSDMLLIGLTAFAVLAIIPGFLAEISAALYPVRYTLPAAAIFVPVVAALVARRIRSWRPMLQIGVGLLFVVALLPDLATYALPLRLTNTYTEAQKWFEANIPDGSVIWMDHYDPYVSLSRYDKGYRGYKSFTGLYAPDNLTTTPELRETVQYLYLRAEDEAVWPYSQGWQGLDQMTRIKTFSGPQYNTPYLSIYVPYALPNAQETHFTLGEVQLTLRGIAAEPSTNTITVTSFWQANSAQPPHDYSYGLYLTPSGNPTDVVAQKDGGLGHRPTSAWNDPNEILRGEMQPLTYENLPAGEYDLWLVIYDSSTGERFALENGETALKLQTLDL
jgi:hypothetical protein